MLHVSITQKKYRRKRILEDVNFTVKNGELVHILAPSGVGKTTLLKSILGYTNFTGSVADDEGSKIVYVQQASTLNEHESVFNAVFYTALLDNKGKSRQEIKDEVQKTMQSLGIWHLQKSKIGNLSGGQMRRVQIAEALVRNSDTFLLDEPDTGLDLFSAYKLISDLRDIADVEKKKIIVVSHNTSEDIMELYSRILILAKDDKEVASIAFYDSYDKLFKYFEEKSVLKIMEKIQSKDEDGLGMGNEYILKYRESNQIIEENEIVEVVDICVG